MNVRSAQFWIDHLKLIKHPGPEDGYFAVPFEDSHTVLSRNKDERSAASIAYFLQTRAPPLDVNTMFFKCQSSEMLFFHHGHPLTIYIVNDGVTSISQLRKVVLGPEVDKGHVLAFPVPAATWFTRVVEGDNQDDYSLFSCSLAPGFHIDDFKASKLGEVL